MKRLLSLLLLILTASSCLSFAVSGQVADLGSSYYAMTEMDGDELNPLLDTPEKLIIGKLLFIGIVVISGEVLFPEYNDLIYRSAGLLGWIPASINTIQIARIKTATH